ncbi:MAG TPA: GNAT family N-acetyltransferase [Vicinamibacterales bacterium]|nr:GNAT family N-acetyltransferase [Vicinamibacterales bacterium]
MTLIVRDAAVGDADMLVALINAAYRVEDFFKLSDRIDRAEVLDKMQHGRFLVLEDGDTLAGCVYVEVNDRVGYFGLLSIDPSQQKQGLGARLIGIAEAACREAGCSEMEIWVVDLRTELPPYYRRFGYVEAETCPFPANEPTSQPCHFIVMRKPLQRGYNPRP